MILTRLIDASLEDKLTKEDSRLILSWPDSDLDKLIDAAAYLRKKFYNNKIMLHILLNAKSGLCPEDCKYCTQSSVSKAPISKYQMMKSEEICRRAEKAKEAGAYRFCMVISSKGPSEYEMSEVTKAIRYISSTLKMRTCASLGILTYQQACSLKKSGLDRYNHNLETSERHFPNICTTHSFHDRLRTVKYIKKAGIGSCCGFIAGMGETEDDLIELAFTMKRLNIESIPVNLFNPIKGTPLYGSRSVSPTLGIKLLALFRFVNPSKEIRIAGGRERNLKSLQYESLKIANSMFTNGYLTALGMSKDEDVQVLQKMGFEFST
ncbi:MAG: biotin synthase BioB [Planctomycetes bacterium]|nr:biotin synthase BioB [Planctomycetota bacterium]